MQREQVDSVRRELEQALMKASHCQETWVQFDGGSTWLP